MADETVSVALTGDASQLDKVIAASSVKIKAAFSDLGSGGGNIKTTFTEATQSLIAVNAELARTPHLTDAQAEEVAKLANDYSDLSVEAAKGHEAIEKGSARNITSLRSLDSAFEATGNKAFEFVGGAIAVGEAFKFGFTEGEHLREKLNELSDGAFDKLIQQLPQFQLGMALLAPAEGSVADEAQRLNNELNILRKNGIDPTGLSADEVSVKVAALGGHMLDLSAQFTVVKGKITEQNKELALYVEAIEKGGEVTTEQADKIVSSAEEQLKAIRQLPADEQKAFKERSTALQGFIDQYTAATTKFQENTEKEAEAAEKGAAREIAALQKVEAEREKADAKKLESLQKNLEVAQKAEDKGASGGPSDKALVNTKELTKEAEKLKGQIADINAKPLISVEDENLLDGYRASLSDLNRQLSTSAQNFSEIDKASNDAQSRISDTRNAQIALDEELIRQAEVSSEAEIASALAATQYSKNEIAVTKLADGTLKFSNISEDEAITVKRNADGFTELSNAQGDVQKSQADLLALQEKYGESSKGTADVIKDHLNPALAGTREHVAALKADLPELIGLFHQLANVGSGGGSGGAF